MVPAYRKIDVDTETGAVSDRLRRGRHTTRYTRLLPLPEGEGAMVADSPTNKAAAAWT